MAPSLIRFTGVEFDSCARRSLTDLQGANRARLINSRKSLQCGSQFDYLSQMARERCLCSTDLFQFIIQGNSERIESRTILWHMCNRLVARFLPPANGGLDLNGRRVSPLGHRLFDYNRTGSAPPTCDDLLLLSSVMCYVGPRCRAMCAIMIAS